MRTTEETKKLIEDLLAEQPAFLGCEEVLAREDGNIVITSRYNSLSASDLQIISSIIIAVHATFVLVVQDDKPAILVLPY